MSTTLLSSAGRAAIGLVTRLPFADRFEGARAVARREFMANLKSLRMVVVTVLLFLAVVGGAAGFSALAGGLGGSPQTGPFIIAHPTWPDGPNATAGGLVFVTDIWGEPRAGFAVVLLQGDGPVAQTMGEATTGADGRAMFAGLAPGSYQVAQRVGQQGLTNFMLLTVPAVAQESSVYWSQYDAAGNSSYADGIIHAVDQRGAPLSGQQVTEGGQVVATLDARGFARIILEPGEHELELAYGGQVNQFFAHVNEPQPSFLEGGANIVMAVVAQGFIPFVVPIVTIAVAHDAIARERVQGSLDAVLCRPTTRHGVLLGKFVGSASALCLPVYASLSVGAAVIGVMSGKAIDGGFFAAILLAVTAYVCAYTLLLLILSTLAKSTGTAIMFGVLLWLLYNFFWGVVLLLVTWGAGLSPADRGYYDLTILSGLLNLNDLYVALLAISFPGNASNPFTFQGEELLPTWGPVAAYGVWLAVLFLVALRVFNRRAAE